MSEMQRADKDQGLYQAAEEDLAPRDEQAADLQGGTLRRATTGGTIRKSMA